MKITSHVGLNQTPNMGFELENEIGSAVVSAESQDGSDLKPYLRHDLFDRRMHTHIGIDHTSQEFERFPVTFRGMQNHRVFLRRIKAHPVSLTPFMNLSFAIGQLRLAL